MTCLGKFYNDRTCDLCAEINSKTFKECKRVFFENEEMNKRLKFIENICPHRNSAYHDGDYFYTCNRNGKGFGRFADVCVCSLECEKYLKN